MKKISAWTLNALLLLFVAKQEAKASVINFDTTPGGSAIASGTNITNTYASVGVTFSVIPCSLGISCETGIGTTPLAVASADAASPPNVIGLSLATGGLEDLVNESFGIFKATFSTPQNMVSINVLSFCISFGCLTNDGAPYLKAFNSANTLIATATTPSNVSAEYTLTDTVPGIAYVEFSAPFIATSGSQETQAGAFDNLTFVGASTGSPEPRSMLLVGLSLFVTSVVVRYRQRRV